MTKGIRTRSQAKNPFVVESTAYESAQVHNRLVDVMKRAGFKYYETVSDRGVYRAFYADQTWFVKAAFQRDKRGIFKRIITEADILQRLVSLRIEESRAFLCYHVFLVVALEQQKVAAVLGTPEFGKSLDDVLPINEKERFIVGANVLYSLIILHRMRISHNDLYPRNVLIVRYKHDREMYYVVGEKVFSIWCNVAVKLMDFGNAKLEEFSIKDAMEKKFDDYLEQSVSAEFFLCGLMPWENWESEWCIAVFRRLASKYRMLFNAAEGFNGDTQDE